jgi:hypothetical protein
VFVKDTDILLSGDKWTIVVNIALDDYTALVPNMKFILGQVRHKLQMHKNPSSYSFDIHWEEVNRLEIMVMELDNDLQDFWKLLFEETLGQGAGMRARRGLINVLGYGMKYLFGTADARDVTRLTTVYDKLHDFK